MITSRDVFTKRRENLDEAYQMALELVNQPNPDDWDYKSLAWCLVDLIKRDSNSNQRQYLPHYQQQLQTIPESAQDDVLTKQFKYALSLCSPFSDSIRQAKSLSQAGQHFEAAEQYRAILRQGENAVEVQTSLGWELYRLTKELTSTPKFDINQAKRYLNEYLQLEVEKPSLLHACILQQADKLGRGDNFNLAIFSRLWNLEYLRTEDFDRQTGDDGKDYPALAEKVIQFANKQAIKGKDLTTLEYLYPYLDKAESRYTDNIWLKFYKAKALLALGNSSAALAFAITVTKAKSGDFWAWELLGDIVLPDDTELAFSCYCKALLCSSDINFTAKVKVKLANQLIEQGNFAAAKHEVEQVIAFKEMSGHKITNEFTRILQQNWYNDVVATDSNKALYIASTRQAEEVLYSQLPWEKACLGEKFTITGKNDKPKTKRKLFLRIKDSAFPIEIVIPESKFELSQYIEGDALQVKGEYDANKIFQVYVVATRDIGEPWDIFEERIGVIDHLNSEKKLAHFIVSRHCDGVIPFTEMSHKFQVGDPVAVKLSKYSSKQGDRYRVLHNSKTDKEPSLSTLKSFSGFVRVSNGMGFTDSNIFIAPPLIQSSGINDGDYVSGTAIISFNKKRREWGWKALNAQPE